MNKTIHNRISMKTILFTAMVLCSLGWNGTSLGQARLAFPLPFSPATPAPELTRFDLKFPGGTPGDLVRAIESAMGKPINVIIPTDLRETQLPSFEIKSVTVPELFEAIGHASRRQVLFATRIGDRSTHQSAFTLYGFRTQDMPPSDTSIWYFYVEGPAVPPEVEPLRLVQFYNLSPYLERYQVEDITTAVKAGWELLRSEKDFPMFHFHEETKLLIASGTHGQQAIIQSVLSELRRNISIAEATPPHPELKRCPGNRSRSRVRMEFPL
jgi:hypothetical protein